MSQTTYRFKFNRDLLNSIKEFSKITDTNLINKVKPISIKPIEKVGLTLHSCFYVLKHPSENRFLTVEDLDVALNILLPINYTVNEILTRIEMKRMKQLVYVLNK